MGAPTILLRPTTTAFLPAMDMPAHKLWDQTFPDSYIVSSKAARSLTATCLFDELHAAVWGAGEEAVTQVSSSKLPGVDTRQPEQNTKHTQENLAILCVHEE